jgi:hypothetical protein
MSRVPKPASGHHIVPAFLLARFGFSLPEDRDPSNQRLKNLWVYERGKQPVVRKVETQCKENQYFSESQNGAHESGEHEENLANRVEEPFNRILSVIENLLFDPSEIDRYSICKYLAYMFMRTRPRKRASQKIARETSETVRKVADDGIKLRQLAAAFSIRIRSPIDLISLRATLLNLADSGKTSSELQNHFVSSMSVTAKGTIDDLLKLSLSLLISSDQAQFVISDNPVITRINVGNNLYDLGWGFRTPNIQVLMPVSPRACILLARSQPLRLQIPPSEVHVINGQLIQMADRYVYSQSRSDETQGLVDEHIGRKEYGKDVFGIPPLSEADLFAFLLQKALFGDESEVVIPAVRQSPHLMRIIRG